LVADYGIQLIVSTGTVKSALIKLLISAIFLAFLIALIVVNPHSASNGIWGGLIVVIVFPSTLLFGIDASRAIKRETPSHRPVQIFGKALGVPQGVLGLILVTFGVVFPIVGIRDFIETGSLGENPVFRLICIGTAILMFSIGYHYMKESLWLLGIGRKPNKEQ
jgi:hypothetical protein